MNGKSFEKGEPVEWETPQGTTTGKIVKKLTSPMKIKSHRVRASPANPQYLVESEKSGNEAAHKPESLKKRPI